MRHDKVNQTRANAALTQKKPLPSFYYACSAMTNVILCATY